MKFLTDVPFRKSPLLKNVKRRKGMCTNKHKYKSLWPHAKRNSDSLTIFTKSQSFRIKIKYLFISLNPN